MSDHRFVRGIVPCITCVTSAVCNICGHCLYPYCTNFDDHAAATTATAMVGPGSGGLTYPWGPPMGQSTHSNPGTPVSALTRPEAQAAQWDAVVITVEQMKPSYRKMVYALCNRKYGDNMGSVDFDIDKEFKKEYDVG